MRDVPTYIYTKETNDIFHRIPLVCENIICNKRVCMYNMQRVGRYQSQKNKKKEHKVKREFIAGMSFLYIFIHIAE